MLTAAAGVATAKPAKAAKDGKSGGKSKPAATSDTDTGDEVKGKAKAPSSQRDLGVGGGIYSVYPPMLTLQASWLVSRYFGAGVEAGYFTLPLGQFSGSSTYMGLDVRWLTGLGGLYAGLALGNRHTVIETVNNITVNGRDNDVTWTRTVDQTLVYPRVGWFKLLKDGHSFTLGVGVIVPLGTDFVIERDVEAIEGLPDSEMEVEEEKRADEVKGVTNVTAFSAEVKYAYYFDLIR